MHLELYMAAKRGDTDFIKKKAEEDMERPSLAFQESPKSNTILHIAASSGHDQLVEAILEIQYELAQRINYAGDLALHVATSAGHLSIVKKLASAELLQVKNNEGNTPLQNKYREIADFLVETEPEVSYYLNAEHKSPLYMAAEAGDAVLVQLMIEKASRSEPFEESKSIVHAAITGKNMDVLESVLRKHPNLIKERDRDNEGMSPLSYAASIGYLDGVRYLLTKSTDCNYESNRNGFFPIHTASSKGHIEVIQAFLQQCPDSIELLNDQGQNILHVAAMSGKAKVVSKMLKMPELVMLINEKDGAGNTCLHLASMGCHPKAVSILTWDKRVDLNLLNKEGETALDIAGNYSGEIPSFREGDLPTEEFKPDMDLGTPQLIPILLVHGTWRGKPQTLRLRWLALKHAGARHAPCPSWYRGNPSSSMPWDYYKDRVNTLLLVATLVATVTFAAGFTVPGGNNDSEPHNGMATFLLHHMFHIFTISNTIAMYSSVIVVVALIWAQLGDRDLVIASLKFTGPILGLALTMVSLAFMTGSYLIVRDLNWLAYLVLIIGSFFLLILTILFAPLCLPSSLPHPIFRYIVYYPFCLLIIVTRSNKSILIPLASR
uniref:PGG domain-containing protein n=1 Tax=Fagus sylvatica TaxID=28930 RepID=A0A2N9HTH0_FAGSY